MFGLKPAFMKQRIVLLFVLLWTCLQAKAQGENNIWALGYGSGLDFSSGTPVQIATASATFEGTAAVCGYNGQLKFYSDGFNVYNRLHKVMPSGSGLKTDGSVTQAVAIVPFAGDTNKYYLFVLYNDSAALPRLYRHLHYSVVDMKLNNGLGDIVTGQKNITIDTALSEKMTVARSSGCGYWLMVHSQNRPEFHAFNIMPAGLNKVPVISVTPAVSDGFGIGEMKISPDNRKIALANWVSKGHVGSVDMFDFDSVSGKVSNYRLIDSSTRTAAYGLAFSPNSKRLYAAYGEDEPRSAYPLLQYNLDLLPDIGLVRSMKAELATVRPGITWAGMRTYRGKVYVISGGNIHIIAKPDETGTDCDFQKDIFTFSRPFCSLGNDVPETMPAIRTRKDTAACKPVQVEAEAGRSFYLWSDGDTSRVKVLYPPSDIWLQSGLGSCNVRTDTFHIASNAFSLHLDRNLFVCEGSAATLDTRVPGARYLWQNGEQTASISVGEPGRYWVQVSLDGCVRSDTAEVGACKKCVGVPNTFTPDGDGVNDGFRPLLNCPVLQYELHIFNRYGQQVFASKDPGQYWNGSFNGQHLDLGTYYYLLYLRFDRAGAAEESYKGDIHLLR